MAVLQAPQNNDARCHTTLSMREKIKAHKKPKIPNFDFICLVSEKPGTEQACSWSSFLTPELVLSGNLLESFLG